MAKSKKQNRRSPGRPQHAPQTGADPQAGLPRPPIQPCPPQRNRPLLTAAILLFLAWLAYLIVVAWLASRGGVK